MILFVTHFESTFNWSSIEIHMGVDPSIQNQLKRFELFLTIIISVSSYPESPILTTIFTKPNPTKNTFPIRQQRTSPKASNVPPH